MNAAAIIAIPDDEPERLFKRRDSVKTDYRALAMAWHPDRNADPQAETVFAKIGALYHAAVRKLDSGSWHPVGAAELTGRDGKTRRIRYRAKRQFELGEVLIGSSLLTFLVRREHEDLMINSLKQIGSIRYPNETFRDKLERHLPKIEKSFETPTHWVLCARKDPDEVALSDLVSHLGGSVDPKHVAWVVSSLLNLASFLQVNSMTLNGITPSTVFVNPQRHSVSLLGGWWYASLAGKQITSLPPETHRLASRKLLLHKVADHDLDLASIKAAARFALGDPSGGGFRTRSDIPAPYANFLKSPSMKSPVKEYEDWTRVLEDSFGPRRFLKLSVTGNDVYPEGD